MRSTISQIRLELLSARKIYGGHMSIGIFSRKPEEAMEEFHARTDTYTYRLALIISYKHGFSIKAEIPTEGFGLVRASMCT